MNIQGDMLDVVLKKRSKRKRQKLSKNQKRQSLKQQQNKKKFNLVEVRESKFF